MIIKVLLADCDGWKSEEREDGTEDVTNDLGEEEDVTKAHGRSVIEFFNSNKRLLSPAG